MNASVGAAIAGLLFVLLLRPWRLPDQESREFSALIAAVLLGAVLLSLCVPTQTQRGIARFQGAALLQASAPLFCHRVSQ